MNEKPGLEPALDGDVSVYAYRSRAAVTQREAKGPLGPISIAAI